MPAALGLAGFAVNSLPIEVFPGIHLVFGSLVSVLVAIRFGPAAGGVAGVTGGLRTWWLWNQPFPVSACLYGLEGVWVGYLTRKTKRGALISVLSYWILLGSWLNLAAQLLIVKLPLRLALIVQARSIINGMLTGILVELSILVWEIVKTRRSRSQSEPAELQLESLVAVVLTATISLPMLYISTRSVKDVREKAESDLQAASFRNVAAAEGEIRGLLRNYERGVATAASLCGSQWRDSSSPEAMSKLLTDVRKLYPEFAGMYVADAAGRTIAFDPLYNDSGQRLIGLDYSDREYYRELVRTNNTVFSGVYQARGGMIGPTVAIGEPLRDSGGRFNGFVLGWFDLRSFQNIASRFHNDGESLIIADQEGRLIADSSMEPGSYREVMSLGGRQDFERIIQGQPGPLYLSVASNTKPAALATLRNTFLVWPTRERTAGWWLWSKQSLLPMQARLEKFYLDQLLVLMLSLLLALVISRWIAKLFTRPLIELQQRAAVLSAGALSDLPKRQKQVTAEFDSLFRSFYQMREGLEASWKRHEELLNEVSLAKGELEATFEAMTDGVVITDVEDRVLRANRAYYSIRGVDAGRAVGRELTEIAHPGEDWTRCEVCRARREGRHAVVLRRRDENQTGRDLEIRVDPLYDASGNRLGAVQVVRDLTEIREAEAEAENASLLLRNLVDAAYDAVYATDLSGRFLWANKRAADLFGFESDTLEGESFLQSIYGGDLSTVRRAFEAAAAGEAQRYETRYLTSDGTIRFALVTNSPIYAGKEIAGVLAVMRDITEERQSAEQSLRSDKLRALGQLASGVAHNFNNSLTAVLGYTQMALAKISDPKLTRHLKTVETAALDAAKMVQRIQNFAQQRQDEPSGPADLNQTIRDALDLTRSRWRDDARAAGIEYDIIFRPGDSPLVLCDQSAIREVFVNIIINALDAMPSGGRLTITTASEHQAAIISFGDTGCGMTEDVRQRIFEPFYTTKGARGYGMGLAVSFGIIERHGGEIRVNSEPGHGSAFTIKLPLAKTERSSSLAQAGPSARSASVLVVDDEAPIRMLLADLLRARGHKVLMAEDGLAGLRALEGGAHFDLVITDLSMPGADGWTLVHEVRKRLPGTRLMIVTGYGGFADSAVSGGDSSLVDALISKPFNIAEIDMKVNELLIGVQTGRFN